MARAKKGLGLPTSAKERGEVAELLFAAKAASLGFTVLQPYGQTRPFDLVVEFEGRMARVQVKSRWTPARAPRGYEVGLHGCHRPYRVGDLDFIAAYVAPIDTWYIIPFAEIPTKTTVCIPRAREKSKYSKYKEAWGLMIGKK